MSLLKETVIRDIIDVIYDVKDSDEVQTILNRRGGKSFSSIAKASKNLTLIFPVITSRYVPIETIAMVAKAIERKAVTMLQILFSSMSIANVDSAIDYISKFHTNMKIDSDMSIDSFVDAMDQFVVKAESSIKFQEKEAINKILRELKTIGKEVPSDINEVGLNNYLVKTNAYTGEYILEKKSNYNLIFDGNSDNSTNDNIDFNLDSDNPASFTFGKDSSSDNKAFTSYANRSKLVYTLHNKYERLLHSSDIQKCNELVPTMMSVVCYKPQEHGDPIPFDFLVGVKAKIYAVDSADVLKRLSLKHNDGHGLLNFVKASTSEIAFWKDFVFAINRAKQDAKAQSRKGSSSEIWKLLERRALKSKIRRSFSMVNDAPSISTLVVTEEEVEALKKSDGIDLRNPKVIRPIMESYNLMGFVIVDDSLEKASFIFDTGDDIYEEVSYNMLERDSNDSAYRKMVKLITKIR